MHTSVVYRIVEERGREGGGERERERKREHADLFRPSHLFFCGAEGHEEARERNSVFYDKSEDRVKENIWAPFA